MEEMTYKEKMEQLKIKRERAAALSKEMDGKRFASSDKFMKPQALRGDITISQSKTIDSLRRKLKLPAKDNKHLSKNAAHQLLQVLAAEDRKAKLGVELATIKQNKFMVDLGFDISAGLTRDEASKVIKDGLEVRKRKKLMKGLFYEIR